LNQIKLAQSKQLAGWNPFLAVVAGGLLIIALADVPFDETISVPNFDRFAILATDRHGIIEMGLG